MIKTKEQIDGIRKSCKVAAAGLDFIKPLVLPGIFTSQINSLLADWMLLKKAIPAPLGYKGYPKETCISVNEVVCHGIPDQYVLKEGDIVNIDITTIVDGYYGDTSCMFAVGEVSAEAQRIMDVCKHSLDIGISQVYPKNRISNIGYTLSKYVRSQNFSVVELFCGHGVGVSFHEDPQVQHFGHPDEGIVLKPGMIFTIEPMINAGTKKVLIDEQDGWTARTADGKLSAQYEHTVLVTETGVEVLTNNECNRSGF